MESFVHNTQRALLPAPTEEAHARTFLSSSPLPDVPMADMSETTPLLFAAAAKQKRSSGALTTGIALLGLAIVAVAALVAGAPRFGGAGTSGEHALAETGLAADAHAETGLATLGHGKAVQVEPMKPLLKAQETNRFDKRHKCDKVTAFKYCIQLQLAALQHEQSAQLGAPRAITFTVHVCGRAWQIVSVTVQFCGLSK